MQETSKAEFYPTPAWVTYALMQAEDFAGDIWECACGDGAMAEIIKKFNPQILSTDLYDHGYGDGGIDFLTADKMATNIITNPPFSLAEDFIKVALTKAKSKVAFLLRLAFLEGRRRHQEIFSSYPPSRVYILSERATMYQYGVEGKEGGKTAYAWFVWDIKDLGRKIPPQLRWIGAGSKKNYEYSLQEKQLVLTA